MSLTAAAALAALVGLAGQLIKTTSGQKPAPARAKKAKAK